MRSLAAGLLLACTLLADEGGPPPLDPPAPFEPADGPLPVGVSDDETAAGLKAAADGRVLRLVPGGRELLSALNAGRLAGALLRIEDLAFCGPALQVRVVALAGFRRGTVGLVADEEIRRVNDLKGHAVAVERGSEGEFFLRYLAGEAGLPTGDRGVRLDFGKTAGIRVSPLPAEGRMLVTNRNILFGADLLAINRAFAEKHGERLGAVVRALLEGNGIRRASVERAHLANLPENLDFFAAGLGALAAAMGADLPEDLFDPGPLEEIARSGAFAEEKANIAVLRGTTPPLEEDPLLTRDLPFLFDPNVATLDLTRPENQRCLDVLRRMLAVAPGSRILLRGHVDNALVNTYRREGGEALLRRQAQRAMELSKARAKEVARILAERHGADPNRIEAIGRGWEEPLGGDAEANRRIEVHWYVVP